MPIYDDVSAEMIFYRYDIAMIANRYPDKYESLKKDVIKELKRINETEHQALKCDCLMIIGNKRDEL